MFEALSDRFDGIFKRLRGKGKLSEADVDEVLREIRLALLEADVNLTVVRDLRRAHPGAGGRRGASPRRSTRPSRSSRSSTRSSPPPSAARPSSITYASKPPDRRAAWRASRAPARPPPGQAGPLVQAAGPQPAARRRRPPAPGRRRAAAHARRVRSTCRCSASPRDPVEVGQGRHRRGPPPRPRRGHRRHRRPPRHRRRADGRRSGTSPRQVKPDYTFLVVDAMTGQDAVTVGRGLPRDPRARRRHPHQARRRRPRRRRAVGQGGRRPAHRLRLHRREARRLRPLPPRPPRRAHPRHGRHAHPDREGRGGLREGAGRGGRRPAPGGQFTLDDFLDQMQQIKKMGPLVGIVGMIPGIPKEVQGRRDRRRRARPGRGHHPVDDPGRADRPRAHRRLPPAPHRRRLAAPRPAEVNQLIKQFKRDAADDAARWAPAACPGAKKAARARRGRAAAPPEGRGRPSRRSPLELPGLN